MIIKELIGSVKEAIAIYLYVEHGGNES